MGERAWKRQEICCLTSLLNSNKLFFKTNDSDYLQLETKPIGKKMLKSYISD